MVYIFDDLLNLVNARRQALNERVCQMIKNGTLFKKTGDIGLYLTYKFALTRFNKSSNI
jgi:hypothetical protein